MPITVPQSGKNDAISGTTVAVTLGSGIAAGSVLAVFGQFDNSGGTFSSLTDGHGDTVTDSGLGIVSDAGTSSGSFFKAFLTPTTGAQTITLTLTGTPTFMDMFVWEVAGLTSPQIDKVVHASGVGISSGDSGSSGTLSSANEACFGYGVTSQGWGSSAGGTGWTSDGLTTNTGSLGEHQIVSANTALHATTGSTTSGSWIMWFASLMSGGAAPVAETQPHFIARPIPQQYTNKPRLWTPSDGILQTFPEDHTPHFIARPIPQQYLKRPILWTPPDVQIFPEDHTPHFLTKPIPQTYKQNLFWVWTPSDGVLQTFVTKSEPHFIAKPIPQPYKQNLFWIVPALDIPITVQPETQPHFIARPIPQQYRGLQFWVATPTDGVLQAFAEGANAHFLGRHIGVRYSMPAMERYIVRPTDETSPIVNKVTDWLVRARRRGRR